MVYLIGILISKQKKLKRVKFKRLKIPFETGEEARKFVYSIYCDQDERVDPVLIEKLRPCPETGFCKKISITLKYCTEDGKTCNKYEQFRLAPMRQTLQRH
jgi:hypothetical protein